MGYRMKNKTDYAKILLVLWATMASLFSVVLYLDENHAYAQVRELREEISKQRERADRYSAAYEREKNSANDYFRQLLDKTYRSLD